eukprot:TRINITY_DN2551_c0_g3_i1.p1 TRINITY_DN2551_c0_g3~~TRINITY_DN2551_c0_g3_i1.p1  ORF type:complete len:507 (+),score=79.77 TRINITY_DN2551_c0_g3_i1:81-1601(+)
MNGHPARGRPASYQSGGVRECLQPRGGQTHGGAPGRPVAHGHGRPPKADNTRELLNQLPQALGGYRLPASADGVRAVGGAGAGAADHRHGGDHRHQGGGAGAGQERQHRRAYSCEGGLAPRQTPPWGATSSPARDMLPDIRGGAGAGGNRAPREEGNAPRGGGRPPRSPFQDNGNSPIAFDQREHHHGGTHGRRHHSDSPGHDRRRHGRHSHPQVQPQQLQHHFADERGDRAAALISKATEANAQFRDHMEDRLVALDPFLAGEVVGEAWAFLAVYDGHGGSQAAEHCASELHKTLASELRTSLREQSNPRFPPPDEAIADALSRTFQKVDDHLRGMGAWRHGCTATVALLRRSLAPNGSVRLHVANVGDSRAVLSDGSRGETRLSVDHRPTDPQEARRVQQAGGFVSMGRVSGELAVSRALGDHALKGAGVSWRPHLCCREAKRGGAIVIGSDGLWDAMTDREAAGIADDSRRDGGGQELIAKRLVEEAKRHGSMDNIACVVAFF